MLFQSCEATWTVIVTGLDACLEEVCADKNARRGNLNRWMQRSTLSRLPRPGVHAAIGWAMTGRTDAELEWAPARATCIVDVDRHVPGIVIRADPVHLETGADRLTLFPASCAGLQVDESKELVRTLNESLEKIGGQCVFGATERWYMTLPQIPECDWIAPECVEGRDVLAFMPRGADGAITSRLINDAQMVLHDHPLNEARRGRGDPEINSIWPWGWRTGSHKPLPKWNGRTIADHPYARGLAILSGSAPGVVTAADIETPKGQGLILFQELEAALRSEQTGSVHRALAQLEERIVQPLVLALRRGSLDCLQLVTSSGCCYSLRRTDFRKFWRRRPMLAKTET
jgi:hypothetical protein